MKLGFKLKKGERVRHRLYGTGKFVEYYDNCLVIRFDETPKKESFVYIDSVSDLVKVDSEGRKIETVRDKFEIQCKNCFSKDIEFGKIRSGITIKCSDCGTEDTLQ